MSDVLIFVASRVKNVELGQKLADEIEAQGASYEIVNLVDLALPLYPCENEEAVEKAITLTEKVKAAKSLLSVAPEYNGSLPPALNNTMAWISTATKDWRETFNGKPVALATHSGGGGAHVLLAMRQQFSYIGANVLGRELLTHYQKELNPESATAVIKELLKYSKA
jgi:chromate reductase, NAD(P)H dehydrogenase (quinone)